MMARGGIGGRSGPALEGESFNGGSASGRPAPPWYDVTWNPTAGCSPAGPGCDNCTALHTVAQLARMGGKGGARYTGLTISGRVGAQWTGAVRVREDVLSWPLLQRRRRRILVDSLSELFHENLAQDAIDAVHAVMAIADWHGFIVLTRRAEEMRAYYADPRTPGRIAAQIERFAAMAHPPRGASARARSAAHLAGSGGALDIWPLPNLWLGVAVENQDYSGRIAQLLRTPAALRWVCFEPLLGPVRPDLIATGEDSYLDALAGARFYLDGRGRRAITGEPALDPLDWVVAGGEIGAAARPANPDWVRYLRDRCNATGVPFYFKQWGEWAPAPEPDDPQRMVRSGRRMTGRLIEGRAWDETPTRWRRHTRSR